MSGTMFRTAMLAAILARALGAQTFVPEGELGRAGSPLATAEHSGHLQRVAADQAIHLLDPSFTGAGHRWDVEYRMTRTRFDWPWWDAYARIDVLSADGRCLRRTVSTHFSGTVTGSFSFLGEEFEPARPHRVRVTFSQPHTFPFSYSLKLTARPVKGANPGGADREHPHYLRPGTAEAPSWMTGDLLLSEPHRFLLVYVKAGQELRAKLAPAGSGYQSFELWAHDLEQRQLATSHTMVMAGKTADVRLLRNGSQSRFVVVSMGTRYGLRNQRIGLYSPEASETPESPAQMDPFGVKARTVQVKELGKGGSTAFELPGAGEWTHFRIWVQKPVFLAPAPGTFAQVTVKSAAGRVLAQKGLATDPWGHEPTEYHFQSDGGEPPATVEVATRYNTSIVTLDALRRARR